MASAQAVAEPASENGAGGAAQRRAGVGETESGIGQLPFLLEKRSSPPMMAKS